MSISKPVNKKSVKMLCLGNSCLKWPILLVLVWTIDNVSQAQAVFLSQDLPRRKVVVLDPGHGGHDLGAVGPSGLAEKVVALLVAHKIKEVLSEICEVHLTRNDDYRVDIIDRTAVANHYRADIFLSIHAGGGFRRQGLGVVVFYHSSDTGRIASMPAGQQKGPWGIRAKPLPWNYIQGRHTAKTQVLAKFVHRHLTAKLGSEDTVDGGIREAPCLVLRGADMPAVLVEIGHLSHPADEKELRKSKVISDVAQAISEAIKEYFSRYP
ncbi:MAG: hypothetical protein BA872_08270 [Desulfobacterales bacterium C00003060]|nr:MAG: hypothetical protein BA872_08270 [Desulfobacterales bacterium C00003060]OEU84711.1 MAG: hypothetical protein BA865_10550 [Desulfobacterales bacterium S5133MH4]